MSNDEIWAELSKVYNMPDVPDKAKEIIGNVMLVLDDVISRQAVLDLPRHKETFLSGGTYAEYIDVEDIEMLPSIKTPPKGH